MFGSARFDATAKSIRPRALRIRPLLEPLEDRTLPSASIRGTIYNDLNGNGARDPGEDPVAGATVFLDADHNGKLDQRTMLHFDGPTEILTDGNGTHTTPLLIAGLAPSISALTVNLSISTTTFGQITVDLASPAGLNQTVPTGPQLLDLGSTTAGGTFQGSLSDSATAPVPAVSGPAPTAGPFRPQEAFGTDNLYVYDDPQNTGSPNGGWELLFFNSDGGSLNSTQLRALNLASWSLDFTGSEESRTTDSSGNYSFSNLLPGDYNVAALTSTAGPNPSAVVTVSANSPPVTGVDLGITPLPDLAATAFQTSSSPNADWGSAVSVTYTIVNHGPGDAPPSDAAIFLSENGVLDPSDPLQTSLASVQVPALAAGDFSTGTVVVQLPGAPGVAPAGYTTPNRAFLGLRVNADNAVAESNTSNDANQGTGIDLAPAIPFANEAVAASTAVQDDPSVAVDPANDQHLVMAYTDYGLLTTGYGGIAIAESTNGGQTWQTSGIPLPAGYNGAADHATVKFDNSGHIFVSFMALTYQGPYQPELAYPDAGPGPDGNERRSYGMQASNAIFVAHAGNQVRNSDGSLAWTVSAVVEIPWQPGNPLVPFDALPSLAIDTFPTLPAGIPNPRAGTLYVTWTRAYPTGSYPLFPANPGTAGTDIMLAVSTDGGQTWSLETQPDGPGAVPVLRGTSPNDIDTTTTAGDGLYNFSQVTVAPGGDVFVGYEQGSRFRVVRLANTDPTSTAFDFTVIYSSATPDGEPFPADDVTGNVPDYTSGTPSPFRNFPSLNLAADPTRPGVLYAVEAIQTRSNDPTPVLLDQGDIYFARSTDNGASWQRLFSVGGSYGNANSYPAADIGDYRTPVNDDDGGDYLRQTPARSANQEVTSVQALPHLFVDAQGNITIVWYDSRRDPSGTKFDVFAAVSPDGGQSFSANFRVTDTTIDPTVATFTDPANRQDDTLGDVLGVAAANGVAYAAWTDTRNRNQEIFVNSFSIQRLPAPPSDRFAPDNTPATAADLGTIVGEQLFPRLLAVGGEPAYYKVTPGTAGRFEVTASAAQPLLLQAFDATGAVLQFQTSSLFDAQGNPIGEELQMDNALANEPLLFEVSGVNPGADSVPYSLLFDVVQTSTTVLQTTTATPTLTTPTPTATTAATTTVTLLTSSTITLSLLVGAGGGVAGVAEAAALITPPILPPTTFGMDLGALPFQDLGARELDSPTFSLDFGGVPVFSGGAERESVRTLAPLTPSTPAVVPVMGTMVALGDIGYPAWLQADMDAVPVVPRVYSSRPPTEEERLNQFVLGLPEALEHVRRTARERLAGDNEAEPPRGALRERESDNSWQAALGGDESLPAARLLALPPPDLPDMTPTDSPVPDSGWFPWPIPLRVGAAVGAPAGIEGAAAADANEGGPRRERSDGDAVPEISKEGGTAGLDAWAAAVFLAGVCGVAWSGQQLDERGCAREGLSTSRRKL